MIPRTHTGCQTPLSGQRPEWQAILAKAVRDPEQLFRLLDLEWREEERASLGGGHFRLLAPLPYLQRIERGNRDDPLLRQLLPDAAERLRIDGFSRDPVGDLASVESGRLLRKYHGRALLMASSACAIHCRFCFRRSFPYPAGDASPLESAIAAIAADPSLEEVILSGGDPLTLPDHRLATLCSALESIPHLRRLRIHTRLPIVIPQRVDRPLLEWLGQSRLQPVVVTHCNHPAEVDQPVAAALLRLAEAGVTLLNQSVLLRGVNDQAETLIKLQNRLFGCRVLPYYLHLLDRAEGVAHFEVSEREARRLQRAMLDQLPGYLVPRLVREIAGEGSKRPLA